MTTSTAERVRKHRDLLRAAGLRPVQIWVPDTRAPGFAAECRRQSQLVARAARQEADTQRWLQQVADTDGWR
jgi:hypothetical protein